MPKDRTRAQQLAREFLKKGDAIGWFEELYAQASETEQCVPWVDRVVNPHLASWLARQRLSGTGKTALVVGCGLGDDAEELARVGFHVVAFDVSPTAIMQCKERFLESAVHYCAVDLFSCPVTWVESFDFVFEAYTLQVLPARLREEAAGQIARCVAPAGTLLAIARGRDPSDDPGAMPWPLTRDELSYFNKSGLDAVNFEDFFDNEAPPVRRFRVEYVRR